MASAPLFINMVEIIKNQILPHKDLEPSPVVPELKKQNRRTFNRLLAGAILLGCLPTVRGCKSANTTPSSSLSRHPGSLVIAGGGELSQDIYDKFIELAGGTDAKVVVIPTASTDADLPDQTVEMYWGDPRSVASATMLHTRSRIQANLPDFVRPLTEATGVWFSGGQQHLIANAYMDTRTQKELDSVLKRGGVIGGTSAGAAVLSPIMITGGNPIPILGKGFDFLAKIISQKCIIDQHFDTRNRLARLFNALKRHPDHVGLGIGWRAALIVNNSDITVMNNNVWLCTSDGVSRKFSPGEKIDFDI